MSSSVYYVIPSSSFVILANARIHAVFNIVTHKPKIRYNILVKNYYVYILASEKRGTLYIGVTNNLERRIEEHKAKEVAGFTNKYNVSKLVYFENTSDIEIAINREKVLKHWKREWKVDLIENVNPNWNDLGLEF
jgi:putative endonuclease